MVRYRGKQVVFAQHQRQPDCRCNRPWRDAIFYEYYWERNFPQTPTVHAIRTDRYKYMHYHGIWDTDELYDLQNDPTEMNNLINDPDHKALVQQLNKRLFDWLEKTEGMLIPLRRDSGNPMNKRKLYTHDIHQRHRITC